MYQDKTYNIKEYNQGGGILIPKSSLKPCLRVINIQKDGFTLKMQKTFHFIMVISSYMKFMYDYMNFKVEYMNRKVEYMNFKVDYMNFKVEYMNFKVDYMKSMYDYMKSMF